MHLSVEIITPSRVIVVYELFFCDRRFSLLLCMFCTSNVAFLQCARVEIFYDNICTLVCVCVQMCMRCERFEGLSVASGGD